MTARVSIWAMDKDFENLDFITIFFSHLKINKNENFFMYHETFLSVRLS